MLQSVRVIVNYHIQGFKSVLLHSKILVLDHAYQVAKDHFYLHGISIL
jgi:hypothetical protein